MEFWIGLLSGTSADGVDAALVRIGSEPRDLELVAYRSEPMPPELQERIRGAGREAMALRDWLRLDAEIGACFAAAAEAVLSEAGVDSAAVTGIGSHGQTVAHHPEPEVRGSLQLGSAAVIHARTQIPVVADFRRGDLAVGGQGAPLTPFIHRLLFGAADEPRAVLNIGGFTLSLIHI